MITRIPEITRREQVPERDRHHFDAIHGPRGSITAPYRYLLHVPDLASRMAHLSSYGRFDTPAETLAANIRELAVCTAAREMDCAFEWADHEQRAIDAGVRPEAVNAIKTRRAPEGLSPDEAGVVCYIQQLLRPPHRIADEIFGSLRARLGDARLVELTGIVGSYVALSCIFNAFEVAPTPGLPVLPT